MIPQSKRQDSAALGFRAWRHAGEEGALTYRKPIVKIFILQCIALAMFSYFFPEDLRIILAMAPVAIVFTLLEGRRALIFTEEEVRYRPAAGRPRSVRLSAIAGMKRASVLVPVIIRASPRPGVIITVTNGAAEAWPLDFAERDEILRRLRAVTGKTIEE